MRETVVLIRSNPVNPDPPVEKMAHALCDMGYSVLVLAWARDENYKCKKEEIIYHNKKIKIFRWGIKATFGGGLKNLRALALFQRRIYRFLECHHDKIDIIHAYDFDTGFTAQKIAKKYKKKFVYHILDYYAACHTSNKKVYTILSKLENNLINKSDAVLICTEKRKEQIKGSNPKRLEVIHNCPEKMIICEKDSERVVCRKTVSIAYVGIFGNNRFIPELIEIVKQDNRIELNIGGYGIFENEIKKASEECSRIHYYGRVPYEQTLQIEMQSDFMIAMYDPKIENHKYSAPNKVYEAMMLGKPIIMANGTGWESTIEDNKLGIIVEYSINGFNEGVNKMIQMLNNEEFSIENMRMLYQNQYSWEIMRKRIERVYRNLGA